MDQNLAEIHGPGNMIERDTGSEKPGFSMDRRVSVAPMMDWSDYARSVRSVKQLHSPKIACPHSVSTLQSIFEAAADALGGINAS